MTRVSLYPAKRPTKSNPKRKVWQLRWLGTDGKRYCETIGDLPKMTKRDAGAKRRDKQSKIDCGVIPADKPKRMTFSGFVDQDRQTVEADVRPTTMIEYDHAVNHAYAALGRGIALDRIGPVEVGRIKTYLKNKGRATATIRKTIKTLNSIMRRAKDQRLILDNPFSGKAKGKTQSKRKRIFAPEEIKAMLTEANSQWWRVFLKLAVTTGLRKSELLSLHWTDLDFDSKTVTVSRKDTGRFTVRGESYPILPWETKAHEERVVPLDAGVVEMLKRFQLQSGGSQYVFLSLARLRAIDERLKADDWRPKADIVNNLDARFKAMQRRARRRIATLTRCELDKVQWNVGCIHDLRRTWATEIATHVDILTLCRWGGWADAKTAQQFYHEVKSETADRARKAMADLYRETDAQLTRKAETETLTAAG